MRGGLERGQKDPRGQKGQKDPRGQKGQKDPSPQESNGGCVSHGRRHSNRPKWSKISKWLNSFRWVNASQVVKRVPSGQAGSKWSNGRDLLVGGGNLGGGAQHAWGERVVKVVK